MRKDILITGKGGFIGSHISGGRPFKGNIRSPLSVLRQTKNASGVVHLAAVSDWRLCEEDPRGCVELNLLCLVNVLEAALRRKIWVLFVSTFQVMDEHIYGLSKLMGEELCRIYRKRGLRVRILRLPIVYGPGDRPHKIVTRIIAQIKEGKVPKIETRRRFQFFYVQDAVRLIEKEVCVLSDRKSKKYSLHELTAGIKLCLQERGRNR